MTLAFCVKVCMSLATSTKFSGVEGENCFCFDTLINSDPLTNKHCHTKCPGDKSVLCGGHGAMSVTNLEENSVHEVLVLYGGYDNPKFEVINKNGDVCIADTIPGICSHLFTCLHSFVLHQDYICRTTRKNQICWLHLEKRQIFLHLWRMCDR